jgi:hypothetical protein
MNNRSQIGQNGELNSKTPPILTIKYKWGIIRVNIASK